MSQRPPPLRGSSTFSSGGGLSSSIVSNASLNEKSTLRAPTPGASRRVNASSVVFNKRTGSMPVSPRRLGTAQRNMKKTEAPQEEIKREGVVSAAQHLHIHDIAFSEVDLVLNEKMFPHLREGDLVQVFVPSAPDRRFTLSVQWLSNVTDKTTRLQVSMLRSVAEAFGLSPFCDVQVYGPVESELPETEVTFVELLFKGQYISRGEMFRFTEATSKDVPAHQGKVFNLLGIRATVSKMNNVAGSTLESGVLTKRTKVIFRSRSSRIFWLVQMSVEMWKPFDSTSGELYFERFINGFVRPVLQRWREDDTSHSLSIIFFTRTFVDKQAAEQLKDGLNIDAEGRVYRDLFKMVVENQALSDLGSIIPKLKKEFITFPKQVGWGGSISGMESGGTDGARDGQPCGAAQGNFLEAINVTLNIIDKHFMDRDLARTGNSIVMISPSCGIYRVNEGIAKLTKQRMMDNGVGMDMISLAQPPLHTVPIFIHRKPFTVHEKYEIPHWMNISFLSRIVMPYQSQNNLLSGQTNSDSHDEKASLSGGALAANAAASSASSSMPSTSSASDSTSSVSSGLGLDGEASGNTGIDPEKGRFGFGGAAIEFQGGLLAAPPGVRTDMGLRVHLSEPLEELPTALKSFFTDPLLLSNGNDDHGWDEPEATQWDAFQSDDEDDDDDSEEEAGARASVNDEVVHLAMPHIASLGRNHRGEIVSPRAPLKKLEISKRSGLSSLLGSNANIMQQRVSSATDASGVRGEAPLKSGSADVPTPYMSRRDSAPEKIVRSLSPSNTDFLRGNKEVLGASSNITNLSDGAYSEGRTMHTTNVSTSLTAAAETQALRVSPSFSDPEAQPWTSALPMPMSLEDQMDAFDDGIWARAKDIDSVRKGRAARQLMLGPTDGRKKANRRDQSNDSLVSNASYEVSKKPESFSNLTPPNARALPPSPPKAAELVSKFWNVLGSVSPALAKRPQQQGTLPSSGDQLLTAPLHYSPSQAGPTAHEARISATMASAGGNPSSNSQDYSLSFGSYGGLDHQSSGSLGSNAPPNAPGAGTPPTPSASTNDQVPTARRMPSVLPHRNSVTNSSSAAVSLLARSGAGTAASTAPGASVAAAAAATEEFLVFVNPFRLESEEQLLQTRTHARRRWSHVFPMGEHEFKTQVVGEGGLNWKSLSTPAVLPLTTDYVPSANELRSDRYAQRPDSVAFSHASVQDRSYLRLLREMVTQRLTYDFQLVDNEEGSETTALSRMGRQLRYMLSMGHRIHELEAAAPYTQVKVTEFALKSASAPGALSHATAPPSTSSKHGGAAASSLAAVLSSEPRRGIHSNNNRAMAPNSATYNQTQLDHSSSGVGATSSSGVGGVNGGGNTSGTATTNSNNSSSGAEAVAHYYRYLVWGPLINGFQEMEQRFQQYPDALAWNTLDQLILSEGQEPAALRQWNTKHKRLLFAVLPPPLTMLPDWGSRWLEARLAGQPPPPLGLDDYAAGGGAAAAAGATTATATATSSSRASNANSSKATSSLEASPSPSNLPPEAPETPANKLQLQVLQLRETLSDYRSRVGQLLDFFNKLRRRDTFSGALAVNHAWTPGVPSQACVTVPAAPSDRHRNTSATASSTGNTTQQQQQQQPQQGAAGGGKGGGAATVADLTRKEWAVVAADAELSILAAYRLEVNWLVAGSSSVQDLVQTLYKKAYKLGLRLAQVPEYVSSANLCIHSFMAAPFVAVAPDDPDSAACLMPVLELSLLLRFGFTSDRERVTDWAASFPALAARANNPYQTTASGSPPLSPTSQQQQQHQHQSQQPQPQPLLGRYGRGDPQYLHQTGGVAVRVRPGQGFAWVLNRLRVSDLALSLEQRFQLGHSMLADFSLEVERLSALHAALHARLAPRLAANVATTAGEVAMKANEDAAVSVRAGATGVAATAVARTAAAAVEDADESASEASGLSQAVVANLPSSREAVAPAPGPAAAPITSEGSGDGNATGPEKKGLPAPAPHEGNSKSSQRAISGENVHCDDELPQEKHKAGVKRLQSSRASVKDAHTAYVLLLNRVWQFVDRLPDGPEAET